MKFPLFMGIFGGFLESRFIYFVENLLKFMGQTFLVEDSAESAAINPNSVTRLASPDILKAVSIFAVVFIHGSGLISFRPSDFDFNNSEIGFATLSLRFCVPVFIFLWAYFMEKSILKGGNKHVLPRFYRLFIPFAFWSLIYFVLTADFRSISLADVITKHWSGYGWAGQYYFIILFQLILLFPILRRISLSIVKFLPAIYILSFLFYAIVAYSGWFDIVILAKIKDRAFIYWLPYVVLGVIYAHQNIFKSKVPVIIAVFSIVLIPLEMYLFHPQTVSGYLLPGVFLVTLLLLNSIMEAKIRYEMLSPWLANLIRKLAGYTLGIFCLNPLIFIVLHPVFESVGLSFQFVGCSVVVPFFSALIVLVLCVLIIFLLKRIRLGFLVVN